MEKLNFNQHINNLSSIDYFSNILKNRPININELNKIATFILNSQYLEQFESFRHITNQIVLLFESFNNHTITEQAFEDYINNIRENMNTLKNDIIKSIKVNIYLHGEDKYGIFTPSNLNYNCTHIDSKNKLIFTGLEETHNPMSFNILFTSENTEYSANEHRLFDLVIDYNKFINELTSIVHSRYFSTVTNTYNSNRLLCSLKESAEQEVSQIIIGNSYGLTCIEESSFLNKTVNLSSPSTDIYYTSKIAKTAIENNPNIRKCIIAMGHFMGYQDLSLGRNNFSKNKIANIFYPILGDMHNASEIDAYKIKKLSTEYKNNVIKYIFKIDNLEKELKYIIHKNFPSYFNTSYSRANICMPHYMELNKVHNSKKEELARERAKHHNKLLKYTHTFEENKEILDDLLEYMCEKNIEVIIAVSPFTSYYKEAVNPKLINDFEHMLNEANKKYTFRLINFNTTLSFEEMDFMDLDHTSKNGSDKITSYLKSILDL